MSESCVSSLLLSDRFLRIPPWWSDHQFVVKRVVWLLSIANKNAPYAFSSATIYVRIVHIYCICVYIYTYVHVYLYIIYIFFLIHIFHENPCNPKPLKNANKCTISICCIEAPWLFERLPRTTSSRRQGLTTSSHTSHPGSPGTPKKCHVARCCQDDIYLPNSLGKNFRCKIFLDTTSQALMIQYLGLGLWIKCSCCGGSEKKREWVGGTQT